MLWALPRSRWPRASGAQGVSARLSGGVGKGSDNVIAFTTKRYSRTPLVVPGPGAGRCDGHGRVLGHLEVSAAITSTGRLRASRPFETGCPLDVLGLTQ